MISTGLLASAALPFFMGVDAFAFFGAFFAAFFLVFVEAFLVGFFVAFTSSLLTLAAAFEAGAEAAGLGDDAEADAAGA